MTVADHLRDLEHQLHQSSVRRSAAALDSLLHDDFEEYGSSGRVYAKPEIIATLRDESPREMEMSNFKATLLTETAALVRYRATIANPGCPPATSLRSSLWTCQGGTWRMLFHQGTRSSDSLTVGAVKESESITPYFPQCESNPSRGPR